MLAHAAWSTETQGFSNGTVGVEIHWTEVDKMYSMWAHGITSNTGK